MIEIVGALAQLGTDSSALDALLAGEVNPALASFLYVANSALTCGHTGIGTDEKALSATKAALLADAVAVRETQNAAEPDPDVVRFDGIGDLNLSMTAADLLALGFVDMDNLYEGPDAACVRYARAQGGLAASVESASGRVLAIVNAGGRELRTEVGAIGVGSTLAKIREVFGGPEFRIEEYLDADFGQGTNGVVVHGPGGSIGLALDGGVADEIAAVTWVAGVGLPESPPTAAETGC